MPVIVGCNLHIARQCSLPEVCLCEASLLLPGVVPVLGSVLSAVDIGTRPRIDAFFGQLLWR
jgi:hypothetical protein